jgi:hypothetical protein
MYCDTQCQTAHLTDGHYAYCGCWEEAAFQSYEDYVVNDITRRDNTALVEFTDEHTVNWSVHMRRAIDCSCGVFKIKLTCPHADEVARQAEAQPHHWAFRRAPRLRLKLNKRP